MVNRATDNDIRILAEMAVSLWRSHTIGELEAEFADLLSSGKTAFFVKYADNIISLNFHIAMGFIEAKRIICFKKDI